MSKLKLRSQFIELLKQTYWRKKEIAYLYQLLVQRQSSQFKRDILGTMAAKSEESVRIAALRLHRWGGELPPVRVSWMQLLGRLLVTHGNCRLALAWINRLEKEDAQSFLKFAITHLPKPKVSHLPKVKDVNYQKNNQRRYEMTKKEMIFPYSRYHGQSNPDDVVFNAYLQEFSSHVGIICSLQTGGKISPMEAITRLEKLWQELQTSKQNLGLADAISKIET